MKIKENLTRYEDFKYVLQDVGNLYLGAGFSYEELLLNEAVPFKLKAILRCIFIICLINCDRR